MSETTDTTDPTHKGKHPCLPCLEQQREAAARDAYGPAPWDAMLGAIADSNRHALDTRAELHSLRGLVLFSLIILGAVHYRALVMRVQ